MASEAFQEIVKDFPELVVKLAGLADAELLLDDSVRFAEKAEKAGVKVSLDVCPEMFYNWLMFGPVFPEAQRAIDRIGEFIRSF